MCIIENETDLNTRQIVVQTRAGHDVVNSQYLSISIWNQNQFPDIRRKYANATFRSNPTGIYNCHGLSFASRRTTIDDADEVRKIIAEDNYTAVPEDQVLPGDIVLYVSDKGDIEHSAVVISEPKATLGVPIVYSKWGNYAEAVHSANYCPYDFSRAQYYRVFD